MNKEDQTSDSWVADGIGNTRRTVYLRKRSDDYDLDKINMYTFSETDKYSRSFAPYLELRYGEVLLNFAESACGAGKGQEALDALRELRARVGYTGDCGLDASLAGDRAALFAAILYERQIELAYEGKRFDDMRRWMLWDGGATQYLIDGAPSHWMPTGWGGNTCDYLGVPPLNGTRRTGIYIYYKGGVGEQADNKQSPEDRDSTILNDPLMILAAEGVETAVRPPALDLMKDPVSYTGTMAALADYYNNNFGIKRLDNQDGWIIEDILKQTVDWKPRHYFLGLRHNAQSVNPTLYQTIGWDDRQGHGIWFDPLAE
ncbi:MAG: RagB/SusD family nutrient uptake outer membrane protein [Rikenellaceae bacterium]|nr:RagB/SusD family nutrient uptake outer membrane protein [Rikenellaceae bacterium]